MSRRTRHVVIFARQPALGRVKTRLARDIGALAALRFYRWALMRTARRIGRDRRWRTWLAVTPDRGASRRRVWPFALPRMPQGHGDLGQRMARALRAMPRGAVVIIGADIPDLAPVHVARAFALLGRHPFVFGPAEDGGYWLVGARGPARGAPIFDGVRWSTEHALADTLRNIGADRCARLAPLRDVDDGAALAAWRSGARLRRSS